MTLPDNTISSEEEAGNNTYNELWYEANISTSTSCDELLKANHVYVKVNFVTISAQQHVFIQESEVFISGVADKEFRIDNMQFDQLMQHTSINTIRIKWKIRDYGGPISSVFKPPLEKKIKFICISR
ncbi:unnamed protein product [Mucor hiemalis]